MRRPTICLALLAVVLSSTTYAENELKTTPDELPGGMKKFNGMLVGRLAGKDVEKGTFLVHVDTVSRVWRNSRAENPKSVVGKTVEVGGVFGRFLDVLVVTRKGETLEFECKHDGDGLTFPGEMLRRVEPYDASDYPELPEAFRGFKGAATIEVEKKDPETFEMIVKVESINDTWKESKAKEPKVIEGKRMLLAGFWNRKEQYHKLKAGERLEVGLNHISVRSDHVSVAEFVRPAKASSGDKAMMKKSTSRVEDGLSPELRGFRGMLVGRLVKKDVERGTFSITVDAVPRVWRNNESRNPKSLIGKVANASDVPSRLLDALVVARTGDTLEFGALHEGGDSMRVGEVLRKVAPVKPGDYPVLPDDFRGFRGVLVGKVIKKDDHLMDLIIDVKQVSEEAVQSKSKEADSIVGKKVMLSGFWRRKEAFHDLSVGDMIRFGAEHQQRLTDNLTLAGSLTKVQD